MKPVILKVAQIVPMEDPASLLVVGTVTSGEVRRGAVAALGNASLATVHGTREVAAEEGAYVGVLMRCRSVADAQAWLGANLGGKSIVFRSTMEGR